ncbi:YaaC family protein [Fictibacillus nanhaiensis]|uniref:YaaC family protein n=1 Tax=Fictibacillus nanhaiensis TaxID=742169 RepID=UPI001C949F1B|nr:YaaC family protein [Fictibacillus nanhaiensis]MBY6038611.1 YaaC family protein [Fictibacillus nanhaiensis]
MVIINNSWPLFDMFFSSQKTQRFLAKQYEKLNVKDYNGKSFDNTYGFIYYIEHGKNYYQLADQAPVELKPVMLFYGMTQLMKACILCADPDYPDSSAVLAHGLSTRKRKKRSYEFLLDEVRVQKTGLFNHFCEKLFHMKHIEGEKFLMDHLLQMVPELGPLYKQMNGSIHQVKMINQTSHSFTIAKDVSSLLHMSNERFVDYIESYFNSRITFETSKEYTNQFMVHVLEPLTPFHCFPFSYHISEEAYYFPVNRELLQLPHMNELMVHYVLLYNLSMISRYDTEWWSELFHTYSSEELPFINQFLNITSIKIPYLFGQLLHTKNTL